MGGIPFRWEGSRSLAGRERSGKSTLVLVVSTSWSDPIPTRAELKGHGTTIHIDQSWCRMHDTPRIRPRARRCAMLRPIASQAGESRSRVVAFRSPPRSVSSCLIRRRPPRTPFRHEILNSRLTRSLSLSLSRFVDGFFRLTSGPEAQAPSTHPGHEINRRVKLSEGSGKTPFRAFGDGACARFFARFRFETRGGVRLEEAEETEPGVEGNLGRCDVDGASPRKETARTKTTRDEAKRVLRWRKRSTRGF